MFSTDEEKIKVLKTMNLYLKNEKNFNSASKSIKIVSPNFIIDNIFLLNIGQYCTINDLKELINKLDLNLNNNGKILLCY